VKELVVGAKDDVLFFADEDGHTALHHAVKNKHLGVVKMLAARGDYKLVHKKSWQGKTALDFAKFYDMPDAEKLLQDISETAPLTPEEYEELKKGVEKALLQFPSDERFASNAKDFVCGKFDEAASGIFDVMNVDDQQVRNKSKEQSEIQVIEDEVKALNHLDVSQQLEYILREPASEKKFENGLRDQGHVGMVFKDFVEHNCAKAAKLTEAEVAVLRLYTTSAFKQINDPLRDETRKQQGIPHPLPYTVMLIGQGIKRLRKIGLEDGSAQKSQVLWRGMKNLRPTDKFAQEGGTEVSLGIVRQICMHLLPCSTFNTHLWDTLPCVLLL